MHICNDTVNVNFSDGTISLSPNGGSVAVNSREIICFRLLAQPPGPVFDSLNIAANNTDFTVELSPDKLTYYVADTDANAGQFQYTICVKDGENVVCSDPQIINRNPG